MKDAKGYLMYVLVGAIVVISILLPYVSEHPDGLEKVADDLGFIDKAVDVYTISPFPDYDIGESSLGSVVVAIIGIMITLMLGLVIGYLLLGRNKNAS